jgi:hypothetical protein
MEGREHPRLVSQSEVSTTLHLPIYSRFHTSVSFPRIIYLYSDLESNFFSALDT